MTFNSVQYFVFFAAVLALYFRFDRRGQNRVMLVAGAIFYGAFDWRFLGLLAFSIVVDFNVAQRIAATDDDRRRKILFGISLSCQLGVLGFFKYANFFADSLEGLLDVFGLHASTFTLSVVLPIGISFYTFQTLGYVMSVYRRQVEPERDLVTFATFVSWFPQLVAGPIERASSLLPQIKRRRGLPEWPVIESGAALIVQGLFKKVVLADSLAGYVDTVYADPRGHSGTALMAATVAFAIQVYGDFSGYTDIARGSSRLLGVELRRNFEQPFLSRDIREFWQRWHTSLNAWFIDFVATPLGAARRGRFGAAAAIITMFALIGAWHGAAWTFVVWGVFNGVLVALWRQLPAPRNRHPMKVRLREIPSIFFTFGLFCVGAIAFRADSFGTVIDVVTGIIGNRAGDPGPASRWLIPIMAVLVVFIDLAERRQRVRAIELLRVRAALGSPASPPEAAIESPSRALPPVLTGASAGVVLVALVIFSGGDQVPFVYFQF